MERWNNPCSLLGVLDQLSRPLRDLRLSLTDRCNFRCRYCMPIEVFGPKYQFLPKSEVLTFGELVRTTQAAVRLGAEKIRLTGGEPLMRRGVEDLVARIAAVDGVNDLAMTTNGILLNHHAASLKLAGLNRVTVSLDALDGEIFAQMNGVGANIERVLAGIETALEADLPVKVNMVVQKGVNEGEILPMLKWCLDRNIVLRFIEYMDVGESNGWQMAQVVSAKDILATISEHYEYEVVQPEYGGEVAKRWRLASGAGEFGIISSVTQPFCGGCTRLRVSAEGQAFTCLFASRGADLKKVLRNGDDEEVMEFLSSLWKVRKDQYSKERGLIEQEKAEMSYLGG